MKRGLSALKYYRLLNGISQLELSMKAGISQQRLSLLENCWTAPMEWEKEEIAHVLRVDSKKLFGERNALIVE